jgi:hypothetical protein
LFKEVQQLEAEIVTAEAPGKMQGATQLVKVSGLLIPTLGILE